MARKFSLKDNPIFQRLEVPKPRQVVEDAPGDNDQEPIAGADQQLRPNDENEGQILTLKNRPPDSTSPSPSPTPEKQRAENYISQEIFSTNLSSRLQEGDAASVSQSLREEDASFVEDTEHNKLYASVISPVESLSPTAAQSIKAEVNLDDIRGSILEPQNLRVKNYSTPLLNDEQEESTKSDRTEESSEDKKQGDASPKSLAFVLEDHLEKSQFFGFYNEVTDNLLPTLNPAEQILYSRLFRLSYGFNRNYCTVSQQLLRERTGLSRNTVRIGLQSLVFQQWLHVVDAGNHVSTTYRVILPREKQEGLKSDPQILTLKYRGSKKGPQNLRRKSRGSKIDGQEGQKTELQNLTLKYKTDHFYKQQKELDQSVSKSDPQNPTPLLLTNNSITLSQGERNSPILKEHSHTSATDLVDSFYKMISQQPASAKRERGVSECIGLLQDGFSTEQIQYAMQWTATRLEGTGSFSRVVHFIDQALRDRETEGKKAEKKRTDVLDQQDRRLKDHQRESEEKRIDEIRGSLSSDEMQQLTTEATELIAREHGDLRYGRETLIQIKVRDLIRRRYQVSQT